MNVRSKLAWNLPIHSLIAALVSSGVAGGVISKLAGGWWISGSVAAMCALLISWLGVGAAIRVYTWLFLPDAAMADISPIMRAGMDVSRIMGAGVGAGVGAAIGALVVRDVEAVISPMAALKSEWFQWGFVGGASSLAILFVAGWLISSKRVPSTRRYRG